LQTPVIGERVQYRGEPKRDASFTFQRIDLSFTPHRLNTLGIGDIDPRRVGQMDAADQIPQMQRIGQAVAKEQVKMETLKSFF
jgi:hypothetical protein